MPKHAGQSRMADLMSDVEHYPVKKKWQTRQLRPNWLAIAWLESDANEFGDTEIEFVGPLDDTLDSELNIEYAYGRERKRYTRPMFQIIPRDAFSGMGPNVTPCSCDRFELSWDATRCETHAEIEWDWELKRWKRDTGPTAHFSPDPAAPTSSEGVSMLEQMYRQINAPFQGRCECASCCAALGLGPTVDGRRFFDQATRRNAQMNLYLQGARPPGDPNEGRPGWRFDPQANQYVRDPQLTGLQPWVDRLEVSGETLQGIQSFSIEVEPDDDNR